MRSTTTSRGFSAASVPETARELAKHGTEVFYLHCDVTTEEDLVKAAAELERRWGGVDIVVNNAGVATAGKIEEASLADWQWVLNINLLGVVRGCKVFTPMFKKQGSGYFVNIASSAGLINVLRGPNGPELAKARYSAI